MNCNRLQGSAANKLRETNTWNCIDYYIAVYYCPEFLWCLGPKTYLLNTKMMKFEEKRNYNPRLLSSLNMLSLSKKIAEFDINKSDGIWRDMFLNFKKI